MCLFVEVHLRKNKGNSATVVLPKASDPRKLNNELLVPLFYLSKLIGKWFLKNSTLRFTKPKVFANIWISIFIYVLSKT